jgi:hypothetical protein
MSSRLQRVSVAVPFVEEVDPGAFIPVFHDWIRRGAVEGMLIDVARYAHVYEGPGVMLVGHEGDYAVDFLGGAPSLRYTLKRDAPGTPRELVARSLRRLAGAIVEVRSAPGEEVDDGTIDIRVYDRLRAPNTAETAATLTSQIEAGVRDVLGHVAEGPVVLSTDPREPFGLRVRLTEAASLAG